ncbi:MAG: SRPBCC family protein, partial [Acidimicrobiales bacterium]
MELSNASTLPASWYHDPVVFEQERQAIFAREWQVVARSSQVGETGSYVATELAGWPVVVVRGEDGALRGFHNVCRHRAGPLVWDGDGRCSRFVCRYHGWSYALDGALASARDFGDADDFDPTLFGLHPVVVQEWRGLVFAVLDAGAPALTDYLAELDVAARSFPMEDFAFATEVVHEVAANWKTYADNYHEGYHVPLVHPGLNRDVDATRYRVEVDGPLYVHTAPTRDGAVNAGCWMWRYPGLALNLYPNGMNIERWVPVSPGRTRLVYWYFFRDPDGDDAADVAKMSSEITAEDVRICEAVQRNLEAGVYDVGRLSPRHENAVFDFQQRIRAALALGPGPVQE